VPSSIQSIQNETVTEGDNVNLTCNPSGVPLPTVSWVKVSSGQRFNVSKLVFTNINRSEAGEYRCEASNECGSASETASIDVQYKPENLQFGADKTTVCQNDVVTFTCSADGNPVVHIYQFYENDTLVHNSSSGVWRRTMSTGGMFIYKCVANNTVGTASSMNVHVTVNVPSFINAIQNETVTEGDNVNLTCNPSGVPLPTVSWVKVSSGQRFHVSELVFTNVSRSEAGEYRCEASNECGNASESASVDVQFKPDNIQLLASESKVCQDSVVTFTCSADGNPVVHTYQLYENGSLVSNSSSGVWNRTMSSGGVFVYKCVAHNSLGTAMSTRTVTVNVPSSIQAIDNKAVTEGNNVNLTCDASGIPLPTVSWIKVGGGQRTHSDVLVLTNISRSEAGEYRCEASNECGNASESASIDVQYPPEITHISDSQTLNNGDQVTLNCTVDGNPTPNISWTRLSDNSVVTFPLTVTGKQDEGNYRCTANNGIGKPMTRDTSITVHFPASIQPLEDIIVKKGETATLFCNVSGNPAPNVSWTHVSSGLKHDNDTWVITVNDVSHLGKYRCDASNKYGNDSEFMSILFEGGKCETRCVNGKKCRHFGIHYLCLCELGKKGQNCAETEALTDKITVGVEFGREEFKKEYEDLKNAETKKFTQKVENACKQELSGIGLTRCRVTRLRPGSVIADLELTFSESVSQSDVGALLQEATGDGKLGELEVGDVTVGRPIDRPKEEEDCNVFFEGEDCKKAKPALIALCAVAGVVVLALLIAIIACSMHKKNRRGQGSVSNGTYAQRHDPEG